MTGAGVNSVAQIHTYRETPYQGSNSLMVDNDFNDKSLLDIRTKLNQPSQRSSKNQMAEPSSKKRPQSSQVKRSQISHKTLHKPVIEGDIMVKI